MGVVHLGDFDGVSLGTMLEESNVIVYADGVSLGTMLEESTVIVYADGVSLGT